MTTASNVTESSHLGMYASLIHTHSRDSGISGGMAEGKGRAAIAPGPEFYLVEKFSFHRKIFFQI